MPTRRDFVSFAAVAGFAGHVAAGAAGAETADEAAASAPVSNAVGPPNILLVLADDLGYGDLSCLNPDGKINTPHHDQFAAEGLTCTDAHSPSAVCTPTRYGLLTGRYAWRAESDAVLGGFSPPMLEAGRLTLAAMLKERGYATACFGKWHLGLGWRDADGNVLGKRANGRNVDWSKPVEGGPHTAGFDHSFVHPASLDMAPYCFVENGVVEETPSDRIEDSEYPRMWRAGPKSPGFEHRSVLLEFTRRCEQWIVDQARTEPAKPWFGYFAMPSPHTPLVPREPFVGSTSLGPYGDFVTEHDWSLGRVLAALKRSGQAQNTLVIVTSDNGPFELPANLEEKGHEASGIYRGQKSDAWDGGHRVPFLARWPGVIEPGRTTNQTICLTDLMATCATIAGAALADDAGEDSVDLVPMLDGTHDGSHPIRGDAAVVHASINSDLAIRDGRWKLVFCGGSGGWSLPEDRVPESAPDRQLYDMQADPEEQHNLIAERPEVARRLEALLERYRDDGRSVPRRAAR